MSTGPTMIYKLQRYITWVLISDSIQIFFNRRIVVDEPVNIQILEMALRETYEIITAENGYDAIRQVKETIPDLILLDVMLPDIDGFHVCKVIKADDMFADIPVLFLTAMDTKVGQMSGLETGGIEYLTKPIDFDLLKMRMKNHIDLINAK